MSATAIFFQAETTADRLPENSLPWDLEAALSVVESDTWLLSFIDVLTLLLALFVLLLAQEHQRNKTTGYDLPEEPVLVVHEPAPTPTTPVLRPFSAIQLPSLPQIVTPLGQLRMPTPRPVPGRMMETVTQTVEQNKPAPAIKAEANADVSDDGSETDVQTIEQALPVEKVSTASPVNTLMETLRTSGLADRIDIQSRTDSLRLDIADSILFAPAQTTLTDSGLTLLKDLSVTLETLPWSLSVEGHTDNVPIQTPRFPSNWELSTARATVVARALIQHGIRPDRIRAIGYADTQPRDNNETPEGRNRNRRVTFVLELPETAGETP